MILVALLGVVAASAPTYAADDRTVQERCATLQTTTHRSPG